MGDCFKSVFHRILRGFLVMRALALVIAATAMQIAYSASYYLPGVSPHSYQQYEAVRSSVYLTPDMIHV